MPPVFNARSNLAIKLGAIFFIGLLLLAGGWVYAVPRSDYWTGVSFVYEQPVPFSHKHHVADDGIDCRYCHASVETAANAGMPATHTCMTCHSELWTNAAVLEPVRASLAADHRIAWQFVNRLPDYVYFNHSIHIAKGVGCATCHGPVDRMALTYKAQPFTMQWCLDCHRDPGPRLRPSAFIFDTEWRRGPDTPTPAALLETYHIGGRKLTDCSICHR
jgi:hypothetical protein